MIDRRAFRMLAARVGLAASLVLISVTVAHDSLVRQAGAENRPNETGTEVFLYFKETGRPYLKPEKRVLHHQSGGAALGKTIVKALIRGPSTGMTRTIPANTLVRSFFVTADGTAFVDLTGDIRNGHPGGCRSERMTLFSIVNSLTLNVPEIKTVKFLINGLERETLAGHLDTTEPFSANMLLNR
jgi:Sporulation and spore germination